MNFTVNDISVSYNDEGPTNKAAVIFVHGFPFNKSIWDFQLEALRDFYHVLAYDVRGHGNSESGTADFSIDLFADDLIHFMNKLNIGKAIICGHSMGGYIALNAIGRYPNRFEGLILCDTQSKSDNNDAKEQRMKTIEDINVNGVRDYAEQSLKKLFAFLSFTSKREEIMAVRDMIIKTPVETLTKTLQALAERKDTTGKLGEIKIPVLIMVGKKDIITTPEKSEFLHENIENSTLELIDYAGHLPNLENASEFNRGVKKFLDRTTAANKQPYFKKPNQNSTENALEDIGSKLILQIQRLVSRRKLA